MRRPNVVLEIKKIGVFLVSMFVFWGLWDAVSAYVMPPEQLLEFMSEKVPGCESMEIGWTASSSTLIEEGGGTVEEIVWFRRPNLLRVLRDSGEVRGEDVAGLEAGYLGLFCGDEKEAERLLIRLGVAGTRSSYTRHEGEVAYRIGSDSGGGPTLLLEKKRFLPLLLLFEPRDGKVGGFAKVRFRDYRKVGEGWFPFEILYDGPSGVTGAYTVRQVLFNRPPPERAPKRSSLDSVSPSEDKGASQGRGESESDRLKKVIRAFEQKYGENGPREDSGRSGE